jgi:serine/threonine-protein kinase
MEEGNGRLLNSSGVSFQVHGQISEEAIRTQLERILGSDGFARSERMSRFLRFIVEETLAGRGGELKEYCLGVEVFDRRDSFDPRTDPVVRGEARRLRFKLKEYYEGEGRSDGVRLTLPKGSYVPQFSFSSLHSEARLDRFVEPPAASRKKGIAVLPFVNLSPDRDNEYFSDGLTEEIINALTKLPGLCVVARTSVFQLKGKTYDVRKLKERLNVDTVMEGSVRRAGERLRIAVQLVNAGDGYHLWSETYEREMSDIFAIQEEIARSIVTTLRVQLGADLQSPVIRRSSQNLEAYHAFLKGRFYSNTRTVEGLMKSIGFYEQAAALDLNFAEAYAGLAESFSLLSSKGLSLSSEAMPKAKAAALQALTLDETVAEAHAVLGTVSALYEWNWAEARAHFRRALRVNPGSTTARHWYASDYLAPTGHLDEAIAVMQEARQLDPLSAIVSMNLGFVYIMNRQYDLAIEEFQSAQALDPRLYSGYTGLGRAYTGKGMYKEAIQCFRQATDLSGGMPYVRGILAHCYAMAGQRRQARNLLTELVQLSNQQYVPFTTLALIHIGLGECDRAMEWLEKAYERKESSLVYLNVYPTYDNLRHDSRFRALIRRMGLDPEPMKKIG